MTRYVSGWIEVLQQDRLQTEMKALTNYKCFFGVVYSRDLAAASREGVTLEGMQQVF